MKKIVILAMLLLFQANAAFSMPAIYFSKAALQPQGAFGLRLHFNYFDFDETFSPAASEYVSMPQSGMGIVRFFSLYFSYGLSQKITLAFRTAIMDKYMRVNGNEMSNSGLTDSNLAVKYMFMKNEKSSFTMALFGKIPTGKFEDLSPGELALGTGSPGISLRLLSDIFLEKLLLIPVLIYDVNLKNTATELETGDMLKGILSLLVPIGKKWSTEFVLQGYLLEKEASISFLRYGGSLGLGVQYGFNKKLFFQVSGEYYVIKQDIFRDDFKIKTGLVFGFNPFKEMIRQPAF